MVDLSRTLSLSVLAADAQKVLHCPDVERAKGSTAPQADVQDQRIEIHVHCALHPGLRGRDSPGVSDRHFELFVLEGVICLFLT